MQSYITNYMIIQPKQNMRFAFLKFFLSAHTDKTFKKTRKNALKERKYAVLTVDIRKNGVFTNY